MKYKVKVVPKKNKTKYINAALEANFTSPDSTHTSTLLVIRECNVLLKSVNVIRQHPLLVI